MMTSPTLERRKSLDFMRFWIGETISNLGSSFTQFVLPLLVFKLTGSALNLGIATAATYLPYLLFGLVIGAWVDRVDRKRLMIIVDIAQTLVIASIPVAFLLGSLSIWWVYGVAFVSSTLKIIFDAGQFAAIPSLIDQADLVTANGRIQASFFGATILGPVLAGALLFLMPVPLLLFMDAGSFLISASLLSLIATSFNTIEQPKQKSIRDDVIEGLRYVLRHPILRNISIMLALVNFLSVNREAQLVLLAKQHFHATDGQFGLLNSVGGAGVVVFSLLAGVLRKRGSLVRLITSTMQVGSLATLAIAIVSNVWLALPCWALVVGMDNVCNIFTGSLRQEMVPNHMLGRVQTVAGVMTWSALPIGALLGSVIANAVGSTLVFVGTGVLMFVVITAFSLTGLRQDERSVPGSNGSLGCPDQA